MKIEANDHGLIVLTEVYNPIVLRSAAGEEISICMRDSGFEFSYAGTKFSAKLGSIDPVNNQRAQNAGNILFDQVTYAFRQRIFGHGFPDVEINMLRPDQIELFWHFVKTEVLPYYIGITDVPDEYMAIYESLWLEELKREELKRRKEEV
jgi:hypothetical protein